MSPKLLRLTVLAALVVSLVAPAHALALGNVPTADPQSVTVQTNLAKTITLTATDLDGDPLTYSVDTLPTHGGLDNTAGSMTCPTNDCSVDLLYTPDADYNGPDSFVFTVDDGVDGTSSPATVTITVNAPPTFTKGADENILEDAGPQTVLGWATGMSAGPGEGGQVLSFVVTNDTNPSLFGVAPAINAISGTLTYTPGANQNGTATISVRLDDDSGGSSGVQTFDINVASVNDGAPVLANTNLSVSVVEDAAAPVGAVGALVSTLTGGITDVDTDDPAGIAITNHDEANGTWWFTLNGGASWATMTSLNPINSAHALLLGDDASTRVYYQPNTNFDVTSAGALTIHAWDQSSGTAGTRVATTPNGGTTAFSSTTDTVDVLITAINDAPVLANTVLSLAATQDDPAPSGTVGALVGSLTGGITDPDTGALQGIAITASDESDGTWWFSTDGGTNWTAVGAVSDAAALLLADDASTRLYFEPTAAFSGTSAAALTIRAWDQTSGVAGGVADTTTNGGTTAFSTATDTVDAVVSALNSAPALADTVLSIPATEDDPTPSGAVGVLVGTLTGGITDADLDPTSIAIVATDQTNGTWFYTTNGGGTWTAVGAVSGGSSLLLADNGSTRLYFRPDPNFSGTSSAALTIRAWDQTSGTAGTKVDTTANGGTTAFSSATDTVDAIVSPVNDAPVLANTSLSVSNVEDAAVPTGAVGALIGTLTGGITDVDGGDPTGIAITASVETSGTWYFTTDGGTIWTAVGAVTGSSSLLLADDGNTRLYFRPNANFNGTSTGALTIRAWDQSTGTAGTKVSTTSNGGTTAFSAATDTVDAIVSAVNDAPVLANTALSISVVEGDPTPTGAVGAPVSSFTGGITDPDTGAVQGIAITASDETNGTWWYTTDGGTNWTAVGAVADATALLLADDANTSLYFEPSGVFNGTSTAALTIRAWDQTSGTAGTKVSTTANGGATAFSSATDTVDAVVSALNNAPVLANTALSISAVEDDLTPTGVVGALVSSLTGGISDVDSGDPSGLAITSSIETNGTWFYTTNGGATWTAVGAVSGSSSLLLADNGSTRLYFRPSANFNGTSTAALTIRAWDQSTGTAGTKTSTTANGGNTAFSSATDTVDAIVSAVNDVPTFTKGANQTVAEDSGAKTVAGWATGMSAGPADESGQALTFLVTADTNIGLFTVGGRPAVNGTTGTLTFTPAANANGTATITLRLTDNGGTANGGIDFSQQTFTITVTPVNDGPPSAANDVGVSIPQNATAKAIPVLANDSTLLDTNETLRIVAVTQGAHGKVAISGGGTGLTYTPVAAFRGSDSFTYTISDGSLTDTATVLLSVVQAGTVTRVTGADRYAVSAAISKANFPVGVPVVYIASGLGFADALSGAPVAGIKHGPILLVPSSSIPAVVATELTRLKPAKIVILGGTASVTSAVATTLQTYTTGTVSRLAGADRYATSAAVSKANFLPNVPVVYIAGGAGFADAVSGAPVAAIKGGPILLVRGTSIPAVIATELTRLKPAKIVILGGTGAVSSGVATSLDAYTTGTITRLAGADRYATSAAISKANFTAHVATVYIATGLDFPDALSGSPVAAGHLGPILLVPSTGLPAAIITELIRLKPANIIIFGNTASVPDATKTLLGFYTTGP